MTHEYIETIKRYYQGCNSADRELMLDTFSDDVVHYFVDQPPVVGAQALANFWAKVGPKTQARWTLDHALVHGDEAVIEWSMFWTPPATQVRELLRGAEWYVFRDGKIAEVRSYHNNYHLHDVRNYQLRDFPYDARGYVVEEESSQD